jgi:hypothetical protein
MGTILPDGTDLRLPYPRLAEGRVRKRSEAQLFVDTVPQLVLGMCGGPVFRHPEVAASTSVKSDSQLLGIVEGIVPVDYVGDTSLRGLAVIVEAEQIAP